MGEDDGMLRPHGVVPALVTPLTEQGAVDEAALRRVVDHVVGHGVHGVFALGSAGEIYGLGRRERRRVLEVTVDQGGGRVPVYCGASDITTTDCIETVRMAHEVGGVDAFSVLTPYFMTPSQPELVQHFRAIAASTDLPVMLYANPARTHVPISVAATVELAPVHNIIGIKDSTGDMALLLQYVQETPDDFTVLVGNDAVVLPGLYLGATGAIASTASALPERRSACTTRTRPATTTVPGACRGCWPRCVGSWSAPAPSRSRSRRRCGSAASTRAGACRRRETCRRRRERPFRLCSTRSSSV